MPQFAQLPSKLPHGKTSIFSVMSKMAREHNAIDLSQGFPNFDTDDHLKDLVCKAMKDGHNQYPPMNGIPQLREQIAAKIEKLYGTKYKVESEITITTGATEALFCAISAFVHPGDEVIVFKPAYDTYEPGIKVAGGKPVYRAVTREAIFMLTGRKWSRRSVTGLVWSLSIRRTIPAGVC